MPCIFVGMTLDQYIRDHGLTEVQFAALAGTTQPHVNRLRKGLSRPSWELVSKIADATNGAVTANDFMQTETAA